MKNKIKLRLAGIVLAGVTSLGLGSLSGCVVATGSPNQLAKELPEAPFRFLESIFGLPTERNYVYDCQVKEYIMNSTESYDRICRTLVEESAMQKKGDRDYWIIHDKEGKNTGKIYFIIRGNTGTIVSKEGIYE